MASTAKTSSASTLATRSAACDEYLRIEGIEATESTESIEGIEGIEGIKSIETIETIIETIEGIDQPIRLNRSENTKDTTMALPKYTDTKLWLAILHELDLAGGSLPPRILCPKIRQYFPEITDADLARTTARGASVWTNTIHWARHQLVYHNCIDNVTHGIWRLTDTGRQWLHSHWRGPHTDYSDVPKPSRVTPGHRRPKRKDVSPPAPDASIAPVASPVEQLCQRLQTSQRQSKLPQLFEEAVVAAFQFPGFDAQHIGGAGDTDLYVRATLGPASYSVIVDAKSTQAGRVTDAQISWPVIEAHRQARGATYAAVVGEDFAGGQLQKFADQYKVTLITTDMLCSLQVT